MWRRWVEWTSRTGDVRPQALARVLVALVMVWDLGQLLVSGLAWTLYVPAGAGGLVSAPARWSFLGPGMGPIVCGVATLAYLCAALGLWTRASVVIAVLLHAQLGHLIGPTDRGIDQLVRLVLVMLVFGEGHRVTRFGEPVPGRLWPADLVRFQLVLMYLGAGVAKVVRDRDWFAWSDAPPLATILADPLVGTLDPQLTTALAVPLYALGVATIGLELSAPLLLTRWRAAWGAVALVMHVGIALTLDIGAFSAGVLATFPLVFDRVRVPATWRARLGWGV